MSVMRICKLSLCFAGICFAENSFAGENEKMHQTAVGAIAMEQVCNEANPGMNASIENALANDPSMAQLKPEVRKVQSDPAHKAEVATMLSGLRSLPIQMLQENLCGMYAPK